MKRNLFLQAMALSVSAFGVSDALSHEEMDKGGAINTPPDKHFFFDASEAEIFKRPKMHSQFMLTAEQTEGRYSFVKEKFLPGFDSYKNPHAHEWHTEVFFVTSGEMQWTISGETRVLGPGDLVYIPPRATHAGKVLGDQPVEAVMLYEPGGYERNYMKRRGLTEEQMKDQELIKKMMHDADVNPKAPEESP